MNEIDCLNDPQSQTVNIVYSLNTLIDVVEMPTPSTTVYDPSPSISATTVSTMTDSESVTTTITGNFVQITSTESTPSNSLLSFPITKTPSSTSTPEGIGV